MVQILSGVFDPPADRPAFPMTAIGLAVLAIAFALLVAATVADRALSRLSVVAALRER